MITWKEANNDIRGAYYLARTEKEDPASVRPIYKSPHTYREFCIDSRSWSASAFVGRTNTLRTTTLLKRKKGFGQWLQSKMSMKKTQTWSSCMKWVAVWNRTDHVLKWSGYKGSSDSVSTRFSFTLNSKAFLGGGGGDKEKSEIQLMKARALL